MMSLFSTVNRKQCLQQQRSYYRAEIAHHNLNAIIIIAEYRTKVEAIEAETAAVEAGEGRVLDIGSEPRSNKTLKVVVGALGRGLGLTM